MQKVVELTKSSGKRTTLKNAFETVERTELILRKSPSIHMATSDLSNVVSGMLKVAFASCTALYFTAFYIC